MNPAIKRLTRELAEINGSNSTDSNESMENENSEIKAQPLGDNLFEWHFEFNGPAESVYADGRYHGRILFPADYPFAPPSISFLTPNGRWEVERKICLSVTGFHPELWQPAWSIRTILLALRDHMQVDDKAAIGYLDYSPEARRELARKSRSWRCPSCHGAVEAVEEKQKSVAQTNVGIIGALSLIVLIVAIVYYLWRS